MPRFSVSSRFCIPALFFALLLCLPASPAQAADFYVIGGSAGGSGATGNDSGHALGGGAVGALGGAGGQGNSNGSNVVSGGGGNAYP